jgi:hypothetical protein
MKGVHQKEYTKAACAELSTLQACFKECPTLNLGVQMQTLSRWPHQEVQGPVLCLW